MVIDGQTTSRGKLVHLVRFWNPWGKGEWKGDWSDKYEQLSDLVTVKKVYNLDFFFVA